ncbi:hypothetical protein HPB51_009773 [Rhipicephalus microplus]|uniref:Uncharacterized protein n=1 Tax=Rhipicephalus microplus TaxID=6941 RepID=A0A9J6F163_RHIMP|nr:hypothetical protein HPB51_009773 [Rhipicephalus microplus]
MSATSTFSTSDEPSTGDQLVFKRRKLSENQYVSERPSKRAFSMTDTTKRVMYSALAGSNGVKKTVSPMSNNKPNSAKKLVIKNFGKSETHPSDKRLRFCVSDFVLVTVRFSDNAAW